MTAAGYYVENDFCQMDPCTFWIYEETNGVEGLQRDDDVVDDTCHGAVPGDTIVF